MSEVKNRLQEAFLRDPELGEREWSSYLAGFERDRIIKRAIREGLFSDAASALGAMHDTLWRAAQARTIGRELVTVIQTKQPLERFIREGDAYVVESGEAPPLKVAGKVDTVDVRANVELSSAQEWTESFAEDASFDVIQYYTRRIGYALAKQETNKIISLFNNISAGDLAGGAEYTISSPITWQNVVELVGKVEGEDFVPTVVAVSPTVFTELRRLDQFINNLYNDPANMKQGVMYHTTLGVTFVSSSLVTKSIALDKEAAAVLLSRREPLLKSYEKADVGRYGIAGSERIGLAVLRSKAVARGSR